LVPSVNVVNPSPPVAMKLLQMIAPAVFSVRVKTVLAKPNTCVTSGATFAKAASALRGEGEGRVRRDVTNS
jgi:hypothetical protein